MNQKKLWNDNWYFAKTAPGVEWEEREKWAACLQRVDLPHDWLIYNTLDLYEDSIGWYRKEFAVETVPDGRVLLYFEGVYMDSTVFVNGQKAGDWKYGYSSFEWDITRYLQAGNNEVVVMVRHLAPNSRWYSGAGIYRNVWLMCVPEVHIPSDGIYVTTVEKEGGYELLVDTEVDWGSAAEADSSRHGGTGAEDDAENNREEPQYSLLYTLYYEDTQIFRERKLLTCGQSREESSFFVDNPRRWDVTEPNLYRLKVELCREAAKCAEEDSAASEGKMPECSEAASQKCADPNSAAAESTTIQQELVTIGFRTLDFTPEQGFLLNGRKVRLNGACDHHDLGALGAAFSKAAMRRKLEMMRRMGVNAIRTSHNMPAPELMEMADEMGFLVLSEAFDMWEIAKNTYDYARFFKEWAERDVRSWIRRDRNHPCVIMWSIGNEIPDTHVDAHGQEITKRLMAYVRRWDYRENAPITIGSNYMPWENAQKCADIVKLAGYNYAEKFYAEHHRKYPDWIIYGSETSSVVQSRGVYHFPLERATLMEEDEQCSALGNSTTSWAAKNAEYCITMDRNTEYSCGQFIWTAFDYIGEPTPYQTKNSYFGQIDTAGFPKDSYYLYQAEWTDYREHPMVHVYPYWDFNPGQLVDVRICSNAPVVELFVNGVSRGKREIDHANGTLLQPHWKVAYEPGCILAVAYDLAGNEVAREERHSFGDTHHFVLQADKTTMLADGEDMIFVEISAEDKDDYPVENAADYVQVTVTGAGRLVGLDNGDSTDYDQYKGTVRKLFNGKLLAVIAAKTEPGEIAVTVEPVAAKSAAAESVAAEAAATEAAAAGMQSRCAALHLQAVAAPVRQGICAAAQNTFLPLAFVEPGFVPVRKVELAAEHLCLTPEQPEVIVRAHIYPDNATDIDVIWKVVDAAGMESRIAEIQVCQSEGSELSAGSNAGVQIAGTEVQNEAGFQGGGRQQARITALGDGEFYVRCMSKNGTDKVKLISQLDMCIQGMGAAFTSPYEMVSGISYSSCLGDVGRGPSDSAGTDKDTETRLTYTNLDFGDFGSNELTLSIFANDDDAHALQIWQGVPGEAGCELLGDVIYQKPGEWEVFKPETYRLSRRVFGVQTLTIAAHDKLFLEGFVFARQEKAFEKLEVAQTGVIYGDSYQVTEQGVERIGNNVSIQYEGMNFGEKGTAGITICGRTPLQKNTIQLRFAGAQESVQVLEFPHSEEYICQTFALERVCGQEEVTFVFLPGCSFDFAWFRFE